MTKKTKKILIGTSCVALSLGVIGATAGILITNMQSNNVNVGIQRFNVLSNKTRTNGQIATTLNLDPNQNEDALMQGYNIFKSLTKKDWQREFDKNLSKFYTALEFENENHKTEVEAEIKKDWKGRNLVDVVSVNANDTNKEIELKVEVTYKVEIEHDFKKRDWEETRIEKQIKTIKVTPTFANLTELSNITQQLIQLDKYDQEISNEIDVDFDDLLELYVGKKYRNGKWKKGSIFGQVVDLMEQLNSSVGGLLGMKLQLKDLAYSNKTSKITNVSQLEMFAPLISRPKLFSPNLEYDNIQFNGTITRQEFETLKPIITKLVFDLDKLKSKTFNEFKTEMQGKKLNNFLKDDVQLSELELKHVQEVQFDEQTTSKSLNNMNAAGKMQIVLSTQPSTTKFLSLFNANNTSQSSKTIVLNFTYFQTWFKK